MIHKTILFPQHLLGQLTQEEFEAILAHEAAHLRWYDGLARLYVDAISTLFWWIPAQWLRRRLVLSQEYACDDSSRQLDIPAVDLASAIVKSARSASSASTCLPVACFINQSPLSLRLRRLLTDSPALPRTGWRWTTRIALGCLAVTILLGKYWIF